MQKETTYAQERLNHLISQKIARNPLLSMRSLARRVGVNPSTLSRILSGQRNLTLKMAVKFADSLELSPKDRHLLFQDFYDIPLAQSEEVRRLDDDSFESIKYWYHYAISQLTQLSEFREDLSWIARTLGITILTAKLAIERLERVGILARDGEGNLYRTSATVLAGSNTHNLAIREYQKQILEKAITSLELNSVDERDITSIMIATNVENIDLVKEEIKKFRLRMAELLGNGERTRVYNLGIHLIPVSHNGEIQ